MIVGWKSLNSHRELPTNKSVSVLCNDSMLFCGVVVVQDTITMLPLVPGYCPQLGSRPKPTFFLISLIGAT
jgi:hypothetical protein